MMRFFKSIIVAACAGILVSSSTALGADPRLPTVKGKKIIAMVNEEPITLEEFSMETGLFRPGAKEPSKEEASESLRRMINITLILQEAKRMGLSELKEIKDRVDVFSRVALREELIGRAVRGAKVDEKEVAERYKELVKEWKVKSIVFEKEEDARAMEAALSEGKDFDEVMKVFLADGRGKGTVEAEYLKNMNLLPEVSDAILKTKVGSVAPIIHIKSGFVILKVEGIRYPESPEAKQKARLETLEKKQRELLTQYDQELRSKYAKINQSLFEGLDFEAKEPGFDAILKDKRVLVDIKGEKSITVGEFAEYAKQQLYHGVDVAIQGKKLNDRKNQFLEEMLLKRIFLKEALRLGIDKTPEYRYRVKENQNSLIFGAFVKKVVEPDVKLTEEDLKSYYDGHIKDYISPEMMRIRSLVFAKRRDAEEAIDKLRKGVDFGWLKANAEGQVDPNAKGIEKFEGNLLTTEDLPDDIRKAVAGARSGDFRLYVSSEGHAYVLSIQEAIPSMPQPFQEAKKQIAKKVYNEKLRRAVEEYADKLRTVSDVKIYLSDK
jgi:parvulin-like peptidyl-prolyl isomerase